MHHGSFRSSNIALENYQAGFLLESREKSQEKGNGKKDAIDYSGYSLAFFPLVFFSNTVFGKVTNLQKLY